MSAFWGLTPAIMFVRILLVRTHAYVEKATGWLPMELAKVMHCQPHSYSLPLL